MKHTIQICLLILCSFFLMGCPYSSDVPITKVPSLFDQNLIGTWQSAYDKDDVYTVTKENNEYFIKKVSKSETPEIYKAYISVVKDTKFFNVYDPNSSVPAYSIYKIQQVKPDSLVLLGMSDALTETFKSPDALVTYIQGNMENSEFFEKYAEIYIRR